jgi:hypothetical protein
MLGWPQGRSGRVRKTSPPPEFDPRTVQPVASRYTDWANATHKHYHIPWVIRRSSSSRQHTLPRSSKSSPHHTSGGRQSGPLPLKGWAIGRQQRFPLTHMGPVSLSAILIPTGHSGSPWLVLPTNQHNQPIPEPGSLIRPESAGNTFL